MKSLLDAEMAVYEREREGLLKDKQGKYALIGDGRVMGTYETYEAALAAGYESLGDKNFLVKKIEAVEKVHFFTKDIKGFFNRLS